MTLIVLILMKTKVKKPQPTLLKNIFNRVFLPLKIQPLNETKKTNQKDGVS